MSGDASASPSPSLAAVAELVPFLRARRDQPEPDDLLAAELIADPGMLADVVSSTAQARGCDDLMVLASIWWQGYAYRVAGTTLAAWLVAGSAPDPSASVGSGVGTTAGRPSSLVVGSRAAEIGELEPLVEALFGGHLDPVADALRSRHRIGARLVWGNAAASVASCLAATACAEAADPALAGRVDALMAELPHDLAGLGTWIEVPRAYRRHTCCLWWKTTASKGAMCEDCSLHPTEPVPAEAPQ